jgi:hypothetical protein
LQDSGPGVGDSAGPCDPDLWPRRSRLDGGHIVPVVELFENVGFTGQIMEVDRQGAR